MSTVVTQCPKCTSSNIKELNPEVRQTTNSALCTVKCKCENCGKKCKIKSWTSRGRRMGILY
jgi:transposase-like protein